MFSPAFALNHRELRKILSPSWCFKTLVSSSLSVMSHFSEFALIHVAVSFMSSFFFKRHVFRNSWANSLKETLSYAPTPHVSIMTGTIDEYTPSNAEDPILSNLRRLYIDSFYGYYQFIEPDLNLPAGKHIISWLGESFDRVELEVLAKQCRTFLMHNKSSTLVGLL